jgi:uncharacterized metal-binding protein YceD (DUF177 family)
MSEKRPEKPAPIPWHVPVAVEGVAETGEHFDLTADADTCAAVARVAGLRDLPRLEAHFDVSRHGAGGLRVAGRVSATVGQTCVVTLEPLANEVTEDIDLVFVPPRAAAIAEADEAEREPPEQDWEQAEPLIGGRVDLGALAVEFLLLGLDPYPRKPGAVFQLPAEGKPDESPFAALAALKTDGDGH